MTLEQSSVHSPGALRATDVFADLNASNIFYGIYKNTRSLDAALSGREDFNVLVARENYGRFCEILLRHGALRTACNPFHDNAHPGREDWFVPDYDTASLLHFDVHVDVYAGFRHNKRYRLNAPSMITQWQVHRTNYIDIPMALAADETKISLAKAIFDNSPLSITRLAQHAIPEHYVSEIKSAPGGEKTIEYPAHRQDPIAVRLCWQDRGAHADTRDLARLRAHIRQLNGYSLSRALVSAGLHLARKAGYVAMRLLTLVRPGLVIAKRRPVSGGMVVALIGPDGTGKSTQTNRLKEIFSQKFDCHAVYLGSGYSRGALIRNMARGIYDRNRSSVKASLAERPTGPRGRTSLKHRILTLARAVWAVWLARQRLAEIQKARRMAVRGVIVFSDRWPQAIQPGYLDGPMTNLNAPINIPGYAALARMEWSLYRKMASFRPDLIIHLMADYQLSADRKPGDLTPEEFNKRATLMQQMRDADPKIETVDAAMPLEDVTRTIFRKVWKQL